MCQEIRYLDDIIDDMGMARAAFGDSLRTHIPDGDLPRTPDNWCCCNVDINATAAALGLTVDRSDNLRTVIS
jgi:hypothetical protein